MLRIGNLLERVRAKNASDLHLRAGARPLVRIDGVLSYEEDIEVLTPDMTRDLFVQITTEAQRDTFAKELELDFSYAASGVGRFRFSAYVQRGSISLACRPVQTRIPTIDELALPEVCKKLAMKDDGLVLICGPTGCGKSTTLAAMIEYMNNNISRNIITIEDPIEYIHQDKLCSFSQRQVGSDTKSFNNALRHALRQDPDVILMGEMRDLDSIATTLTAAETGHLVLTTLHAPNAVQAIDRIIDVFPPYQQEQIRLQLASTMRGILFQTLMPCRDGRGRIAAVEVMIKTEAISNLIRQKKNHQIVSVIQSSAEEGMQTLDEAILRLYKAGLISRENALIWSTDQAEMNQRLATIGDRANHNHERSQQRLYA
jgi:twitching motility protein PilT